MDTTLNPATATTVEQPPTAESSTSFSYYPDGQSVSYGHPGSVGYHWDPNTQSWVVNVVSQQYGSDPVGYVSAVGVAVPSNGVESLAVGRPGSAVWSNHTVWPQGNDTKRKRKKETKVVQSAYCEVCKVDCNSKDVLDQHKLGKKHKKNLDKLQAIATSAAPVPPSNPVIGPQENPSKGKTSGGKSKRKSAKTSGDLETKRRKVVEGGAAVEAIRTCSICNVVCNSDTVYQYHLAGQKHAAMLKKVAART